MRDVEDEDKLRASGKSLEMGQVNCERGACGSLGLAFRGCIQIQSRDGTSMHLIDVANVTLFAEF